MNHLLIKSLVALIISTGIASAANRQVLLRPFINHANITDQEVQRIHEVFQRRIATYKNWIMVDSAQLADQPAGACDQDCLIVLAQKTGAELVFAGEIDPTEDPGVVKVSVTLLDPTTWREIQKESENIGPDIESGLGKISSLAKLFDPAQVQIGADSKSQEDAPDAVSKTANWILGGTALAVLALVIYSLL